MPCLLRGKLRGCAGQFFILTYLAVFLMVFSSIRRHTRYWRDWSSDVCSFDLSPSASAYQAQFLGPAGPFNLPGTEQVRLLWTSLGQARRRPQQVPVRGGRPLAVLAEVLIPGGHQDRLHEATRFGGVTVEVPARGAGAPARRLHGLHGLDETPFVLGRNRVDDRDQH